MQRSYNKLLGRIVEIFGTRGAFGKSMGWSDRTTSLKLNGKVDWKQDEIEAACQALKSKCRISQTICPVSSVKLNNGGLHG